MNSLILVPVIIGAAVLIIYLVRQNIKDERKFRQQINNDYRKSKDEEGDIDTRQALK